MELEKLSGEFTELNSGSPSLVLVPLNDRSRFDVYVTWAGIDWRSWVIHFSKVVATKWGDESFAPNEEWQVEDYDRTAFAFRCYNSQWLSYWEKGDKYSSRTLVEGLLGELHHYVLFGGDYTVEVMCCSEPVVEENFAANIEVSISLPKLSREEIIKLKEQLEIQQEILGLSGIELVKRLQSLKQNK